jgi:hypothetical protein
MLWLSKVEDTLLEPIFASANPGRAVLQISGFSRIVQLDDGRQSPG